MQFTESKPYVAQEITTAKLFQNGQNQMVELPSGFHFEGSKVFIKEMGNAIVLIPSKNPWESLWNSLSKFSDDFMETRELPVQQDREKLFE
jgi:antitoxin VapB